MSFRRAVELDSKNAVAHVLLGTALHEQGKNAKELAEFERLAIAKEADIARLRTPRPLTLELNTTKPTTSR